MHNALATGPVDPIVISEVTPVTTPTNDTMPTYTFNLMSERSEIMYEGDCYGSVAYAESEGDYTTTLGKRSEREPRALQKEPVEKKDALRVDPEIVAFPEGTYSDCTIRARGIFTGTLSNILYIPSFTIDTTSPTISEKTPVTTPTTDATPDYTFNTDEAGIVTYGGSCSSTTADATAGDNTITFKELSVGTYSDCTIVVTDEAENASSTLDISTFTIEEGDEVSGTTIQKYKKYKEKYKNQKSRDANKEMKKWKKGTAEEYAKYIEYRNIYREYKHFSKPERKKIMTPEDYEKYQIYKRYKGYKEYKKLRDKVK